MLGRTPTVSGLNARWAQQERIADNISGASSVGHKRQVAAFGVFQEALQQAEQQDPTAKPKAGEQTLGLDWSQGALQKTGQNLDAAISGPGFFTVQTKDGVRLTRNGHFQVNKDNQLVNDMGLEVLSDKGPITIPKGTSEIRPDGSIAINGKVIAQLQIMDVPKASLKSEVGSLFSFGSAELQPVKDRQLTVGALESSNVELPKEMVSMIQNQRMYDMLTRAFQTQDEGLAKVIQDLSGS